VKRFLIVFLLASTSAYGSAILVTDPANLSGGDIFLWSKLGINGATVYNTFDPAAPSDISSGKLLSGNATLVQADGVTFQADNGIGQNDALLLTEGNQFMPESVALKTTSSETGLGAYIQAANDAGDAGTQFTARIQAFAGVTSVLDTIVTSDANGDAVFLGVSDTAKEITNVIFSLTDQNGHPVAGNFVLDQLYILQNSFQQPPPPPVPPGLQTAPAPEPGMLSLMGSGLLALAFRLKKRTDQV